MGALGVGGRRTRVGTMTVSYFSEDVGLAELTELVYRTIVEHGVSDPRALTERLGTDVTAALDELVDLGLVRLHAGVLEPMPPRLPLQALADRHVRAAAAAREASEVLARLWARQSSTPASPRASSRTSPATSRSRTASARCSSRRCPGPSGCTA